GGGCTKQVSNIQVGTPAPINIELSGQNITCFGFDNGEISVNTSGGTDPIVITPSNQQSPFTFTDLAPGTYVYTITDANGCTDTDEYTLTEPELLTSATAEIIDVTCGGLCDGQMDYTVAGGTAPYAFFLIPTGQIGVANGNINSLCANDYQMVITDFNECVDTLEFAVVEPAPLTITYDVDSPTCTGMFDGSAEVLVSGGTGPLDLTISPDDTDILVINESLTIINNVGEESIYFELRDSVGCRILDTLVVVPDIITDMVLTLYSSPETCWNMVDGTATVAVQNGNWPITYLWDDELAQITASATGLASNQEYTVIVTDDIGCTLSATVAVDDTDGCFFIANAITPNGDGSNDTWVLGGLEFYPSCKINVFNRWGQLVYSSTGYSAPWNGTYQGELLPVADYYFTIDYAADKEVIMGTVTIKY
ncbi:MAG: gliding motility-associated C-terminal domain-containing protein, partial [Flavobacteriales bacterium]